MDHITTTDLRTKSSHLIQSLEKGMEVSLIHRSQIVAIIKPQKRLKPLTHEDIIDLRKLANDVHIPKMSYKIRDQKYRKHLREKYGKDLS